jgi:hypothetical protein
MVTDYIHQDLYLLVTPSAAAKQLHVLRDKHAKTEGTQYIKATNFFSLIGQEGKNMCYVYDVLSMFKKISTNTFLLRKRAPTLGYIATLTRQNSRIRGRAG